VHHLVSPYLNLKDFADYVGESPASGQELMALSVCQAVSRMADAYTGRFFAQEVADKIFVATRSGQTEFTLPDLAAPPSAISADFDGDTTFETGLISEPFILIPDTAPYYAIQFTRLIAAVSAFTPGVRLKISGLWGWPRDTKPGSALSAPLSGTTASVVTAAPFVIGDTVVIESEMALVTGISGNSLNLQRGINGSQAVSHNSGVAVDILVYPAIVTLATGAALARVWRRIRSAFADPVFTTGTGGITDVGAFARLQLGLGIPREFLVMLEGLRRAKIRASY